MGTETRTALAAVLRQVEQGILSDTDAYHLICEIIYQTKGH